MKLGAVVKGMVVCVSFVLAAIVVVAREALRGRVARW